MNPLLPRLLATQLALQTTSWSLGEFGALGEFHHDGPSSQQDLALDAAGGSLVLQQRHCTPIAYETISGRPGSWQHGVALCLPAADAAMNRRSVITELGPDADAFHAADRGASLFDLGLGLTTLDFCVRTADGPLLQALRRAQGTSLLPRQPIFERLQQASPHRVLVSRLARLEVRAPIPRSGEHSPRGPHTHLLRHLLNRRAAHSANLPIPAGLLPCLYLYPAHPLRESSQGQHAFNQALHGEFQQLMRDFGAPAQLDAKHQLEHAIARGEAPSCLRGALSRHGRLAMRVSLRQLAAQGHPESVLRRWEQTLQARC